MKQAVAQILTLCLLCWSSAHLVQANTEEPVTSVHGGVPFLLVYADREGASQREPGLYVRSSDGQGWQLAVPGQVQSPPREGGFNVQLILGQRTQRYESVAVVDGRVTLLSILSRPGLPGSLIRFGGRDGMKVLDPLDGTPASVPRIQHTNDVVFASQQINVGAHFYEVVLVSIHNSQDDEDENNGFTFAFVVDTRKNNINHDAAVEDRSKIKLTFDPIVLNRRFINNRQQLSELLMQPGKVSFRSRGINFTGLISDSVLARYARTQSADEPQPLQDWRKILSTIVTTHDLGPYAYDDTAASLPLISIENGQLEISELPHIPISNGNIAGIMVFDPVNQDHGVVLKEAALSLSGLKKSQKFISGLVDCTASGECNITARQFYGPSDHMINVIRMQNGSYFFAASYLHAANAVRVYPTESRLHAVKPVEVSWLSVGNEGLILGSWKFESGQTLTSLYKFDSSLGYLRLMNQLTIDGNFYSEDQLKERLRVKNNNHYFDGTTPLVADSVTYKQMQDRYAPIIDLEESLNKRNLVHIYLEAEETARVMENVEYRRFKRFQSVPGQTGLYARQFGGNSVLVLGGSLLKPHILKSQDATIESETHYEHDKMLVRLGTHEVDILAFVYDSQINEKAGSSSQILLAAQIKENKESPALKLISGTPFHVENLSNILFYPIPQRKNAKTSEHKWEKNILIVATSENRTVAYLTSLKATGNESIPLAFENKTTENLIAETQLSKDEVAGRLRFLDGRPYWVMTPHLGDDDPSFNVIDLVSSRAVLPNRDPSRRILFDRFDEDADENNKNRRYHYDSWRAIYGMENKENKAYREKVDQIRDATEYQWDIFPDYRDLLDDLANAHKTPRHVFLEIPDAEMVKYVEQYPLALRFRPDRPPHWSEANEKHRLYIPHPQKVTQRDVMDNLANARSYSRGQGQRPMILVPASLLNSVGAGGRPQLANENNFLISERRLNTVSVMNAEGGASSTEEDRSPPHILYLLATEGQQIPLQSFDPAMKPTYSMLITGTKEDFSKLRDAVATVEDKRNLWAHFEHIKLSDSTPENRKNMLLHFLRSPLMHDLNYRIDASQIIRNRQNIPQQEAEEILARYLVNRVDKLSVDSDDPVLINFSRVLKELIRELQTNIEMRRRGVIDLAVIENVLARVFPMVLHLGLLPENDPLRILSRRDSILKWRQANDGSPVVMRSVINTILSQLHESSRFVPSSIVVYGPTSTGKTRTIESLLYKVLGLKKFDIATATAVAQNATMDDSDAQVFAMRGSDIVGNSGGGGRGESTGVYSQDQIGKALDLFLMSGKGSRGFIFIDDIHTADPTALDFLFKRIRQLQDSPYVTIRGRKIPTRNLNIIIALNPTEDRQHIDKFTSDKKSGPTDNEVIIASLSKGEFKLDSSALRRFGLILKMGSFDAKGPVLVRELVRASASVFSNGRRYILSSPEAVQEVVANFADVNARSFIDGSLKAMTQTDMNNPHALYIVSPRLDNRFMYDVGQDGILGLPTRNVATGLDEEAKIESFVNNHLLKLPIDSNPMGMVQFMSYLMNNFRRKSYDVLLRVIANEYAILDDRMAHDLAVVPLAHAIYDHLLSVPFLPLENFIPNTADFGVVDSNSKLAFQQALKQLRNYQKQFQDDLPPLGADSPVRLLQEAYEQRDLTFLNLLRDQVTPLQNVTETMIKTWLNLNNLDHFPSTEQWLNALTAQDPDLLHAVNAPLFQIVQSYIHQVLKPNLTLGANSQIQKSDLHPYDMMRLFLMAYDRAIAQLPWGRIWRFLTGVLHTSLDNLTYGQAPAVQRFLFNDRATTIMVPSSQQAVLELAANIERFGHVPADVTQVRESKRHKDFLWVCRSVLKRQDGNENEGQK